jgi:hypothetical protein
MPYRAAAERALADWRAAHARLQAADPASPEHDAAVLEEELAKAAYHRIVEAARQSGLPEPPPFEAVAGEDEPETTMTPDPQDGQLYGG